MIRWALGLLLLAVATPSYGDFVELIADKHWSNTEETDPLLHTTVCRASTQTSDSAEPVELSIAYPKDGKSLPMITLRTRLTASSLVKIKISSKETAPLFLLQAAGSSDGQNVYWYAPVDFAGLEQYIRAKLQLEVFFDSTPVKISLSGSANSVADAKKCLGKTEFPKEFLKLLNGAKQDLTPDLGDRTPLFLWQATEQAFQGYQAGKGIESALAVLRKPFAPVLKKEASAQKTYNEAVASHARGAERLAEAREAVAKIQSDIATAKASLAQFEQEKPLAEADLANKKGIYLPLKEQMKPYEEKVAATKKSVDTTASAIKKNEATIRRNERSIRNLEVERRNLNNSIPGMESDVERYRRAYSDADSEYSRYNPSWEKDRILNNDASYGWAKRDYENAERELRDADRDERQAEGQVNRLRGDLARCRTQPNPNCSSIESELHRAENQVRDANRRSSSARSKMSSAEWSMRNAEDSAERKVRSEESRLRSARDDAGSRLRSAESDLWSARNRVGQINDEIPALRSQIKRAEQALPGLRQQLEQLTAELARVTAERDAFSQQIGFGAAEQAYQAAEARLSEVVKGISALKKEIPTLEKSLVKAQKEVAPLEKSEASRRATMEKAFAALQAIQEQLKPLREQEAPLVADLERETLRFETNRATYQDLYKYLVENGR
jgi:predicted  nucleic acid-binding Zn-ribbon protein